MSTNPDPHPLSPALGFAALQLPQPTHALLACHHLQHAASHQGLKTLPPPCSSRMRLLAATKQWTEAPGCTFRPTALTDPNPCGLLEASHADGEAFLEPPPLVLQGQVTWELGSPSFRRQFCEIGCCPFSELLRRSRMEYSS